MAIIDPKSLPEEFQERLRTHEQVATDYQEQQQQYLTAKSETARLRTAAAALEAEADEANTKWKAMAKLRTVDHRKINTEIERSVQLKQQAESMRRTADMREELHRDLVIGLWESRVKLSGMVSVLNVSYQKHRLQELLATPGLKETLGEIYRITRKQFLDDHEEFSNGSYASEQAVKTAMTCNFVNVLGLNVKDNAPVLVYMKNPVAGEILSASLVAMKRLRQAGGDPSAVEGLRIAQ